MGKGDIKTKRGKIFRGSFGKTRMKKKKKKINKPKITPFDRAAKRDKAVLTKDVGNRAMKRSSIVRKNYLFVIGIDKYHDPIFPNLSNAVFDSENVAKVLIEKYGFELIQPPIYNEDATRKSIMEQMNNLCTAINEDDNLIIYFAGHGEKHPKTNKGYWVPYDATRSISDFVPNSIIKDFIEGIDAKHIFLISDSCFSGTFLTRTRSGIDEKHYKKIDESKSRWVLSSGREEVVSDGIPGKGSPFANSLIKVLSGNKNKFISVTEIINYVTKVTGNSVNQQPLGAHIENIGHEGGQMVLILDDKFVKENIDQSTGVPNTESLAREMVIHDQKYSPISTGKEILIIESFIDKADFLIVELFRFNDDGQKKNKFQDEKIVFPPRDGKEEFWKVIRRFSTWVGLERYIEHNPLPTNKKVPILNAHESIEKVEETEYANTYRKKLDLLLKNNKSQMKCLHCGKKISTNDSHFVEIDETGLNENLGNVHRECLRPLDRILGISRYPNLEEKSHLVNFDFEEWIQLLEKGQGFLTSIKRSNINRDIPIITWNPEHKFHSGKYCIRINLKDSSYSYFHIGKEIHRFQDEEIDKEVELFNKMLQKSIEENDPYCITSVKRTFGKYSELLKTKKEEESLIEVESFSKVKYSNQFEQNKSLIENDYTPIGLLIDPESEKIVNLSNLIPLISDPFNFNNFYENWHLAGFKIKDCGIKILRNDLEFDHYIARFFEQGMQPIIDPLFDRNADLVKGYYISSMQEIIANSMKNEAKGNDTLKPMDNPQWKKGDEVIIDFPDVEQEKYPTGILLEDEMIDETGERCVIFRPVEDGKELKDLTYKMPSRLLKKKK